MNVRICLYESADCSHLLDANEDKANVGQFAHFHIHTLSVRNLPELFESPFQPTVRKPLRTPTILNNFTILLITCVYNKKREELIFRCLGIETQSCAYI